jgi:hypothetical protein
MMQMSSAMPAVWQELAHTGAALPIAGEAEDRRGDRKAFLPRGHCGDSLTHPHRVGQLDPATAGDRRLVVEKIHLRRRTRLEQVDHPLGFGREMGQSRKPGIGRGGRGIRCARPAVTSQQRAQRHCAQANSRALEKDPAV